MHQSPFEEIEQYLMRESCERALMQEHFISGHKAEKVRSMDQIKGEWQWIEEIVLLKYFPSGKLQTQFSCVDLRLQI